MAWSLGQAQAQERHIGKGYLNLLAYWNFDSANAFNAGTAVDVVSKIEGELLGEPKLVVGRSGEKLDRAIGVSLDKSGCGRRGPGDDLPAANRPPLKGHGRHGCGPFGLASRNFASTSPYHAWSRARICLTRFG